VLRWLLLSYATLAVLSVALAPSATAQAGGGAGDGEPETAAQGTLTAEIDGERTPVEGVVLTVTTPAGEEVGTATSGADGKWRIVLPAGGTYEVTLDTSTLPDDAGLREGESETRTFEVQTGRQRGVIFQLGERAGGGVSDVERAINLAVDGLRLGLVIAMAAVGLSLIFGVTGLINFAHGELVTLGALVVWYLNSGDGLSMPFLLATAIAILVGAAAGFVAEKGLFAPLRRRRTGNVALIVVTIGLGIALRNLYLIIYGGSAKPFRQFALQEPIDLGPVSITPRDLWIIVIGSIVMVGVALLLQRTRFGTAMRAVSDNADLAEASGIDTGRVILVTWTSGAALAALGGVLLGLSERVAVDMGERILLLMFAAVILGGLGRAYGALVGSLIIGLTVQLSTLWVSVEFKYVFAFGLLIAVLLVRPQGLLGRSERIG
jgi:branched-chain amino acid transport system permease protein